MSSPLDKCFLEAMDELGFTETPSKSPSKGDDPDACKYYDQIQYPETPEELVLEACSPVVRRAARLVLCLSTNLTGKNKEQDTLDDPPPEALQNEDSFLARSSSVLTPDSFDDSEMIVPESPCSAKVTTVQMVPRSPFSLTSNIDIELESSEESQQSQKGIASIVVPSPDSFNQVIETPESSVPEMTVMPDLMEDVCLSLSGVLAEDSFDLGQDVIASEAAFSESHASVTSLESNEDVADVLPPEETSASLTPDQMSEDERFLYLSVALPDDSFDSDMDKWTLDVTLSEMDPHTASESMNQDLLLPKSGSFPQDSTDHMLDLKAEDILSESSKKEEMPNDELVSEQAADSPDLLSDGGTIDSEICTAISMGDAGEEGDCVTEVSLLDLCAEEKGERENVFDESGDHLRSEEETLDKCAPSVEVPCGQLIVLDDVEMEAEPESCSYSPMSHFPDYPDMAVLTEHVSSLVEEATSTDLTPGEASAESESSDFLDECLLTQMEDSSDDTLTEDSYAEDGLESLLSKVTPLSLLEDGCAQEKLDKE
uniref:Uncharacterized protein n=1 Tax=Knipowitschia caucasica TaxID=637954 RepID=A0AAV2KF53_KNICA